MHRLLIIVLIIMAAFSRLEAQQMPLFDQYMLNGYLLNPAVAGSDGFTTLGLTARSQWIGLPNAPNNQIFSVESRLLKRSYIIKKTSVKRRVLKPSRKGRVGIGGYFFNDMNGSVSRTGFHGSYAYHIRIRNSQLSFGVGGTIYQFHIKELSFYNANEPLVAEGITQPVIVPDADFGVYYLGLNHHAGFSVKNVLQSYLKLGNRSLESYRLLRHYYFTGGYRFEINPNLDLEPSGLLKLSSQLIPQMDFNLKAYYMENYWAGLSVRTNGSLVALLGISVDKYYFGYAFGMDFSSIMRRTFGSHEFAISIKFGDSARRYRWLDRY